MKTNNLFFNLAIYAVVFAALWLGIMWFTNHKVAGDAVDKYEIALRNGDRSTACFEAGVAAASFLSAKDEASYKKWRLLETHTCAR